MHARKSAPGVGGFSRHENASSANDESGGWSSITASIKFPVSSFWITVSRRWSQWCLSCRCQCGVWAQPPGTGWVAPPRNWTVLSPTWAMRHSRHWIWNWFIRRRSYGGSFCISRYCAIWHCNLQLIVISVRNQDVHRRMASVIARWSAHSERRRARTRRGRSRSPVCQQWVTFYVIEFCWLRRGWVCHWMVLRVTTSSRHQDRQGRYCAVEEAQRICTAHTSGAGFFKRRSPDFVQINLPAGNSLPDWP